MMFKSKAVSFSFPAPLTCHGKSMGEKELRMYKLGDEKRGFSNQMFLFAVLY